MPMSEKDLALHNLHAAIEEAIGEGVSTETICLAVMEIGETFDQYTGARCPKCRSERINGGDFEPEGADKIYRPCDCEGCGNVWTETYLVVGCDHVDNGGTNGE